MKDEGVLLLFVVAVYGVCASTAQRPDPTPSENFPFSTMLDKSSNYFLYWKVNSTHITFETHVRTLGYVGFGLSSNGKMFPSDVVIGWVKDGVTYFKVMVIMHSINTNYSYHRWYLFTLIIFTRYYLLRSNMQIQRLALLLWDARVHHWHLTAPAARGSIKTTCIPYVDEYKCTITVTHFSLFQLLRGNTCPISLSYDEFTNLIVKGNICYPLIICICSL